MEEPQDLELDKIAKGWSIAMDCSKDRLRRVHQLEDSELEAAVKEGQLILETVCLFVHACIKPGQYKLPQEFWRVLHLEYGIVVYPSALTERIVACGLGMDVTYTEAYRGHIVMFRRCDCSHPPPCPFEYIKEVPPPYEK